MFALCFPHPFPQKRFVSSPPGQREFASMDQGPLLTGIPLLAPGEKRIISWGQIGGLLDHLGRDSVRVTTTFRRKGWLRRKPSTLTNQSYLEVASFEATDASDPPAVRQVRHLEKIAMSIEHAQRDLRTIADVIRDTHEQSQAEHNASSDDSPLGESTEKVLQAPAVPTVVHERAVTPGQDEKHGV